MPDGREREDQGGFFFGVLIAIGFTILVAVAAYLAAG